MMPSSSATGDEFDRRNQPALRMAPAEQRLGTGQAVVGGADLRLVEQFELIAPERPAQVALQGQALHGAPVHRFVVETEGVAPGCLGGIHRGIGIAQQGFDVVAVGG